MVPLEHQERGRRNKAKIEEGTALLDATMRKGRIGPYQIQAAISALHTQSPTWDSTDWPQIAALYALLNSMTPSKIVEINHAVAVSYCHPREEALVNALAMLEAAEDGGSLENYQPYYAARADILQRAGKAEEANAAFQKAIDLSDNEQDVEFLKSKMQALDRMLH